MSTSRILNGSGNISSKGQPLLSSTITVGGGKRALCKFAPVKRSMARCMPMWGNVSTEVFTFRAKCSGLLRNGMGVDHTIAAGEVVTLDRRGLVAIQRKVTLRPPGQDPQTMTMRHVIGKIPVDKYVPSLLQRLGQGTWEPIRGTVLLHHKCPECGSPSHPSSGWVLSPAWILCGSCAQGFRKWVRSWTGKRPPSRTKIKAPLFYEAAGKKF